MRLQLLLVLGLFSVCAFAQDADPIITDRPTQTAAAFVVPKGSLLAELGFINERVEEDFKNLTFLNAHIRYGLIDGVELRLTQNYVGTDFLGEKSSGLSPLTLGTKIHLANENGLVPQMSIIGQATLDSGADEFKSGETVMELRLNFQNTISDRFSLGYNLGYRSADPELFYTLVVGAAIADGFTLFVEPYAFFGEETDHRFNAGMIYLVNPNLQFDFSFGSGLSEISPENFVSFGASFGF